MLVKNIPLKLISIAMAFLIWYSIGQEITDKVDLTLPFQVTLPRGTDWKIVGPDRWDVKVTLRGAYSDIQRIRAIPWGPGKHAVQPETLESDRDEILYQVQVTKDSFPLPLSDVGFSGFKPNAVDVRLVRMTEKTVRVVPVVEGEPAEGYAQEGLPTVDPPEVRIKGPRIVLADLAAIPTRSVDLANRTSSFTEKKLVVSEVRGYAIECDKSITVTVVIEEKPGEVTVPNVPVHLEYPSGFPLDQYIVALHEETLDVKVRGPKFLLARLDASHVHLVAVVEPTVKEEWFEKKGDSIDRNAKLKAEMVGFPKQDLDRLVPIDNRKELLYKLTRIK
jgi:hypothetical protein